MFSRFSSKPITEFARTLADSLAKRYPPALDANPGKKVSEARLTKVLEETLKQAADFERTHSLGFFRKAKLGNEFRWRLKELGYSESFIETATEGLMVYVTRAKSFGSATTPQKR